MSVVLDPAGDPLLDPDGDPITIGPPDVPTLEAGHIVVHGGELTAPGVVPSLEAGRILVHGGTLTAPPDPELWGTPGGARSPYWGDSVKLFVQLALEQGAVWTLGPHPFDRFDAGNCLDRAINIGPDPSGVTTTRVWTDVSCEVLDLDIASGATASDGVFARAEASTAVIVLADPQRRYDPLNPDSPFMRSTRSRLLAGTPVLIWAETLQPPATVGRHVLFSGRVESWREPQTPHVQNRRATLTCVDGITELAHRRRSVFDTVGAGEPVHERLARILEVFDGPRLIGYDPLDPKIVSEVHLQETELAGTAWELIGKAVDAEIGFAYLAPFNAVDPLDVFTEQGIMGLRFLPRSAWSDPDAPVVEVPCAMVIDATADSLGRQLRNVVIGARSSSGGEITARSGSSIDRYGEIGYRNTDLGLVDNDEVNVWVNYVLAMFAFPRPALSDLTLRPKAVPYSWWWVLRESVYFASGRMLIEWTPPGTTTVYAVSARVTGAHHAISRQGWEVRWQLGAAEMMGRIWTLGPDPHDRFDDRNTLSFGPTGLNVTASVTDQLGQATGSYDLPDDSVLTGIDLYAVFDPGEKATVTVWANPPVGDPFEEMWGEGGYDEEDPAARIAVANLYGVVNLDDQQFGPFPASATTLALPVALPAGTELGVWYQSDLVDMPYTGTVTFRFSLLPGGSAAMPMT